VLVRRRPVAFLTIRLLTLLGRRTSSSLSLLVWLYRPRRPYGSVNTSHSGHAILVFLRQFRGFPFRIEFGILDSTGWVTSAAPASFHRSGQTCFSACADSGDSFFFLLLGQILAETPLLFLTRFSRLLGAWSPASLHGIRHCPYIVHPLFFGLFFTP